MSEHMQALLDAMRSHRDAGGDPSTPAGRLAVANALLEGITVVEADGTERHTGPLVDAEGYLAIVKGVWP